MLRVSNGKVIRLLSARSLRASRSRNTVAVLAIALTTLLFTALFTILSAISGAVQEESFRMAWECARPNAIVTIVALYDRPQVLPLPEMYGKNLTFKTGGVDGCDCAEILRLIAAGELDTTPLITHIFPLREIDAAYALFEGKRDNVMKVAITI